MSQQRITNILSLRSQVGEKTWHEALQYFQLLANQGNIDACFQLGWLYRHAPEEVVGADNLAFTYSKIAAEHEHAGAQYNLAICYEEGTGIKQDETLALNWYKSAADKGHSEAQYSMALYYENAYDNANAIHRRTTNEMTDHLNKAIAYYQLSATQGHGQAQHNLGVCYEEGKGVEQELSTAKYYYELSTTSNNTGRISLERLLDEHPELQHQSIIQLNYSGPLSNNNSSPNLQNNNGNKAAPGPYFEFQLNGGPK